MQLFQTLSRTFNILLGLHLQKLTYALGPDQVHVTVSYENVHNINITSTLYNYTNYFIVSLGYSRKNPHPPDGWGRFLTPPLTWIS